MSVTRVLTALHDLALRPLTGNVKLLAAPNPGIPDLKMPLTPLPTGLPASAYDGLFIGGDNRVYPRGTPFEAVPPMLPAQGVTNGELILHTNGIGESVLGDAARMSMLADATGSRVVGICNASDGFPKDVLQTLRDRADKGKNPAVDTVTELIAAHAKPGMPGLTFSGHSQGSLIVSRAFADVRNRLTLEGGMSQSEADRALGKFKLLTIAGAASHYDDAVRTLHLVDRADVVQLFSLFAFGNNPPNRLVHQGNNSRTVAFNTWNPVKAHDVETNLGHLPKDWLKYLENTPA